MNLLGLHGTSFIRTNYNHQIEVGDIKRDEFFPRVKWIKSVAYFNEFNCSIGLDKDIRGAVVSFDQDKIVQTFPDGTVARFYELDHDFEFDIWLPFRPHNNVVPFTCKSKRLVFYPQKTLKNINTDGSSWEIPALGLECYRPVKFNESIAVYYDGKMNNGYKAGKAFHLYRPLAVDASGKTLWCDWILNKKYQPVGIKIPPSAIYPLLLDPTLGNSTAGASTLSFGTNNFLAAIGNVAAFTMSEDGTANDIQFYRSVDVSAGNNVTMGIYTNPSGVTTALVADTAGAFIGPGIGWKTQSITASLTNGTAYRLALNHDNAGGSDSLQIAYDDGTSPNTLDFISHTHVLGSLPDPFPSHSFLSFLASIYINYTAGGGGGGPTNLGLSTIGRGAFEGIMRGGR